MNGYDLAFEPSWPIVAGNSSRRPCACGLDIVAITDHDGILIAVRYHQQTRQHRAYVAAMTQLGHYAPLPAATTGPMGNRKEATR